MYFYLYMYILYTHYYLGCCTLRWDRRRPPPRTCLGPRLRTYPWGPPGRATEVCPAPSPSAAPLASSSPEPSI